jgi:inner membrane protein
LDSVTQALLGATVGYLVAGRDQPRRAMLYGALAGTLPDLDVLIDYSNEVDNFTRHRGFSHSWIVQTVAAAPLAWLCHRLDGSFSKTTWFWLLWLALVTHAGLDAFTVYGTQLLWPLPMLPIMLGSVFIIDPFYTVPLFGLFVWVMLRPCVRHNYRVAVVLTLLTTSYLSASLVIQHRMEARVADELARQGISAEQVLVTAAPFSIFLWRVVAMSQHNYYQSFASVFDKSHKLHFSRHQFGSEYLGALKDNPDYQRLAWFSQGFHHIRQQRDRLVAADLRMGSEPGYVFSFVLANRVGASWKSSSPILLPRPQVPASFFNDLWSRTWNVNYRGSTL